jgi:NMD protein affecting ribosome stability and mRNA decay
MPSVLAMKCPVCGAENGPCVGGTSAAPYHTERILAANPTRYEHPHCEECRKLKDAKVYAEMALRSYRPFSPEPYKPKSRWRKAWRDEHYRLEEAANSAGARYNDHLRTVHKDEGH